MNVRAFLNTCCFPVFRRLRNWKFFSPLLGILLFGNLAPRVHAGGGGENMLLLVNPNDERSLRITNAYVQARHIPVNNILYITPPMTTGFPYIGISSAQFTSTYQSAIPATISARGLTNQIDYIGTIGHPHTVNATVGALCFQDCLNELTQYQHGMLMSTMPFRNSEVYSGQTTSSINYVRGSNAAIHHSQLLTPAGTTSGTASVTGTASYAQWYLSGMIGYAGHEGLTTTSVIQNLLRTINGDGTKPAGAMYFERSSDSLRTGTRAPYWPAVQAYMTANGIPWIEESVNGGYGPTPVNRKDVMGVEIGGSTYGAPNGCIYLPGSWADSLTSDGAVYGGMGGQTLGNVILLSGGGGSSGTISEPYAIAARFPTAALTIYSYEGSTLGEAFYRTVSSPDMVQFQGDLLSQAYADVPAVAFTTAPADGATVSGTVSVSGSSMLPNLTAQSIATGIASIRLFVDGLDTGAFVNAATGTFSLDTTTLTDGMHEVRIVAYNNSAAASEGCAIRNYQVNNLGQSVSITGSSSYNLAATQSVSIPVSSTQGSGNAITGIQLQSLGRVVGSISGLSGNIVLSATALAFGNNSITPVAVLSGGQQVQGPSITITRRFQPIQGTTPTPLVNRNPGFDFFYYPGAAKKTIATTNFSGTPAATRHSNTLQIAAKTGLNMPSAYCTTGGGSNVGLAIMAKSNFTVSTPGEYAFSFTAGAYWTSCSIAIDGVTLSSYDCWNGSTLTLMGGGADTLQSAYLQAGEHSLTVKFANVPSGTSSTADASMWFEPRFRGVDVNMRGSTAMSYGDGNASGYPAAPFFYTIKKNLAR